jgi:hypothetical protein
VSVCKTLVESYTFKFSHPGLTVTTKDHREIAAAMTPAEIKKATVCTRAHTRLAHLRSWVAGQLKMLRTLVILTQTLAPVHGIGHSSHGYFELLIVQWDM